LYEGFSALYLWPLAPANTSFSFFNMLLEAKAFFDLLFYVNTSGGL
jgi:hypothetical protein